MNVFCRAINLIITIVEHLLTSDSKIDVFIKYHIDLVRGFTDIVTGIQAKVSPPRPSHFVLYCSHNLNLIIATTPDPQQQQQQQHQQGNMKYVHGKHHQQQPTSNKRVVKTVSFNPNGRVRLIPSNSCYSISQKRSMYYNQSDYLSMKCSRTMIIAHLVRNRRSGNGSHTIKDEDADNYCSLGLYTPNEQLERQQRIYAAREALFEEQELQWQEDVVDEDLLADVYFEMTSQCQVDAYQRATQLENELCKPSSIERGHYHLESIKKVANSISMIPTTSNAMNEEQEMKKVDVAVITAGDKRKFVTTTVRGKRNPTLIPSKRSRSM